MTEEEPGIEIRLATPGDFSLVADLMHESFLEFRSSYTDEAFAATTPNSVQLESRMKEGPVWIALSNDAIVGTVSVVPQGDTLYIRGMAVMPKARRLGVGKLLLKQAERFASAQGCKRLTLSTTPFLESAIRLYERSGFRRTGEGPHNLFGTPLFTMVKELT